MADLRLDEDDKHYEGMHGYGSATQFYQVPRTEKCIFHISNGHSTEECRNYLEMLPKGKIDLIKERQA